MLISVTRLRIRRFWLLPGFVLHTLRSKRQVQRSKGFVGGTFARQSGFVFWTLTAWEDEVCMRGFRNGGDHGQSMRKLMDWCDEASYVHWSQDDAALPTAETAFRRLKDEGKISKVRHPSDEHVSGEKAGKKEPTLLGAFSPMAGSRTA